MSRLKYFGTWILVVIAFALFSNAIIYLYLHPDVVGGTIYNMTHKEVVNEVKK